MAYELTIAPALASALEPEIRPLLHGSQILDVGCGGGQIAKKLTVDGYSVTGVDPSRSQVRRFQRHVGSSSRSVQARAEALPYSDSAFDSVYSSCAWKHWPAPAQGSAECVRVTRPGGKVVIVEIDRSATSDEFWTFARTSRIPFGLRKSYLRFAMRTVVGVAPTRDQLASSFDGLAVGGLSVRRMETLPFLVAHALAL
jgi:ubiquinone/menaquinone biosynthesis C-methylase UbiE